MESLFGAMAKSLGHDPNDVRVTAEPVPGKGVGGSGHVLNYNTVRTMDGKELFKVVNMISVETDYREAQEELAELFACGKGDMGIILSGGQMHIFVNPKTSFMPLLRLTGLKHKWTS